MKSLLSLLIFLTSYIAHASTNEFLLFQLHAPYVYRDVTISCRPELYETRFYFEATVSNNKLTRARFIKNPFPQWAPYSSKISFSAEELSKTQLAIDEQGAYWVKMLPVTRKLLDWILHNTGSEYCPPAQLKILQLPLLFNFDSEGLLTGERIRFSQINHFRGEQEEGGIYEGKMKFYHRPYKILQRSFSHHRIE